MAKRYGRWEVSGPQIGKGGQGEVFPVRDLETKYEGTYALKRVINPKRRERFTTEIDAIKRIKSDHVIEIIDHSALEVPADAPEEKQFIVMPLLKGGNLERRAASFKNSIDSVLIVARQIAQGLADAHEAGVIHRDVKPANVLFVDDGNDVKLCDLGICLIEDRARVTATDEAVGPWIFMAPELEGGGQLAVTPAADLYSLGKLIYYLLSGGRLLARERLDDPTFVETLSGGERHTELLSLLRRLICTDPDQRMQTAREVIAAIDRIQTWEERAHTLALSEGTRAALDRLKRKETDIHSAEATRATLHKQHREAVMAVRDALHIWLHGELSKIADSASSPDLAAQVEEPNSREKRIVPKGLRGVVALEPLLELDLMISGSRQSHRPMGIAFVLCLIHTGATVSLAGTGPMPKPPELVFMPLFLDTLTKPDPFGQPIFMTPPDTRIPGMRMGTPSTFVVSILSQSVLESITIMTRFTTQDWPAVQERLLQNIDAAFAGLVGMLGSNGYSVSP